MVICLRMGKNLTAKPHRVIFRSPLPKLHYYHNKRLQARNLKYLTNLQLNSYPNTQSDLFCSDSFPFWCMAPKYMTNGCADSNMWLQKHQSEKIVGCKVLQFTDMMKIRKMLGHKTLRCKYTTTSSRERDEPGQKPCLRSQFVWTEFAQCLCNLYTVWRLLKQSFYMSRVRRKEGPKTYSRISRKSELNFEILKPRQIGGVEKLLTSCRALMNLHSYLISWTDLKVSTLDLETWFLEVVKQILNLPKSK